jgi:NlpC/P60 family putative phage cell wall peptidase
MRAIPPSPDDFAAEARTWIGVPFLHGGRTKRGTDCVGLVVGAARALDLRGADGAPLHARDVPSYGRSGRLLLLPRLLDAHLVPVPQGEARAGDVLLFRIGRYPQHVGISAWREGIGETLIHAYEGVGAVAEHRLDGRWRRRIAACYRLPCFL